MPTMNDDEDEKKVELDPLVETLKRTRADLTMTKADLERLSGITGTMIRMLEQGERVSPSIGVVRKLAQAMGMDLVLIPLEGMGER